MKKYYTRAQIDTFSNYKKNVLNKNEKVTKTLNSDKKKRVFYEGLKKYREGGINSREMRMLLGDFYQRTDDPISRDDARNLAKSILGRSGDMIISRRAKAEDIIKKERSRRNNYYNNQSTVNNIKKSTEDLSHRNKGYSGIKLAC